MKLINAITLQIEEFTGDPPSYAILSHTWGEEEVLFTDFLDTAENRYKAFGRLNRRATKPY